MGARRHFRIQYPPEYRPELIINGSKYDVVDLSESGVKIDAKGKLMPNENQVLITTIGFKTAGITTHRARVVRTAGDFVMLNFETHIPRNVLEREAELLLKQYGTVPQAPIV